MSINFNDGYGQKISLYPSCSAGEIKLRADWQEGCGLDKPADGTNMGAIQLTISKAKILGLALLELADQMEHE